MDSFPTWKARVRKDPLGNVGYNRLLDRFRWVESLFGREHMLSNAPGGSGFAGEHNAAEIPREVGSCYLTAGPTGNKEGFRYATSVLWSGTGLIQLGIDNTLYPSATQMALQVQNCSENGANKPCITSAKIASTSVIEFYSKKLTSALGAGNAWAAEDAPFCAAIHAPSLPGGTRAVEGLAKNRGDWLTDPSTDLNQQVQSDADLRAKFLADSVGATHTTAGVHVCREVARAWASISYSAGAYRILDSSARNPCTTATTLGTGICRLTFTNAWALSAQPFVMTNYAVSNGGAIGDIYVNSTPRSLITTTTVDIYLYKYDPVALTWARGDTDFFFVIHGG